MADIQGETGAATVNAADSATIRIGELSAPWGGSINLGEGCGLHVGRNVQLAHIEIFAADGAVIIIGDDTRFTWRTRIYAHERSQISIGRDCLFASDTLLMSSDVHKIFDAASGERINEARDIVLGDHVWLAEGVRVYKGASIGSGSVIGAASIVTGSIPPDSIAAGVPARVTREGIRWEW